MKAFKILILSAIMVVIASCSGSTKITSSWKSPTATSIDTKKVMVVALLPDKDRELQKNMENGLVEDLKAKGIHAVSAFETFGPKYLPQDEHQALNKLHETGIEDVLTVVLLDKNKDKSYNPGRVDIYPVGYYRTWFGYYRTVYSRVYTPGYYTSNTRFYWESNLYDLEGNKLLYSAQSESFDPSSVSQLASDYSKKIIGDMAKQGLIAVK
jgi:hypothetical protein